MISKEAILQNIDGRYLHDEELEKVVLGMIILEFEPNKFDFLKLKKDFFYHHRHKIIFDAIEKSVSKNNFVDMIFLIHELKNENNLEQVGGGKYIAQITDRIAATTTFNALVVRLVDLYKKRRIIDFCWSIFTKVDEYPEIDGIELFENFNSSSKDLILEMQGDGDKTLAEITRDAVTEWNKVLNGEIQSFGINIGYPTIDMVTGGFHKGDLIIVAGRPSMGKTQVALNMAFKIAVLSKKKAGICSLEMTNTQLVSRLCSMGYEIYNNKFRSSRLTSTDITLISNGFVKDLPIELRDRGLKKLGGLVSKIRKMVTVDGCEIIFIDYLQLIKSGLKNKSTNDEVGDITGTLKELAKELNIPIIALSQLGRAVEMRADKRPMMSDLRDSGNIEQDADIVCFCYRPWYYDKNEPADLMEFIIAKNRGGAIPPSPIELYAYMQYQQLSNIREDRKLQELQQ